jgi:hypothetical protein
LTSTREIFIGAVASYVASGTGEGVSFEHRVRGGIVIQKHPGYYLVVFKPVFPPGSRRLCLCSLRGGPQATSHQPRHVAFSHSVNGYHEGKEITNKEKDYHSGSPSV